VSIVPDVEVHVGGRGDIVEMSDNKCSDTSCADAWCSTQNRVKKKKNMKKTVNTERSWQDAPELSQTSSDSSLTRNFPVKSGSH